MSCMQTSLSSSLFDRTTDLRLLYCIARNFRGLKFFCVFLRINDKPRKFLSSKILPTVNLRCVRMQSSKIKSQKVWARLICESFSPARKFLAATVVSTYQTPLNGGHPRYNGHCMACNSPDRSYLNTLPYIENH